MRNAMKQLGMGLGVLFSLGSASVALAYPPQCYDVCSCNSSCTATCYQGTFRTTCSDEICVDYCRASAPQASVSQSSSTQDEQEQQDASQDVCTEKTEQARSSKS
ncbi:hypothetical protein [Archangium sp.]|uniref:hypothetical protein n=1 Tax=Archangium sp. TaxID=1872627 RepID=UPI00389B1CA2